MDEEKKSPVENEVAEQPVEDVTVEETVVEAVEEPVAEVKTEEKKKPAKKAKAKVVEEAPVEEVKPEVVEEVKPESTKVEPVVDEPVSAAPAPEAPANGGFIPSVKAFFGKVLAWIKANKLISIIVGSAIVAVILALSIALPLCLKDDKGGNGKAPTEHIHAYLEVVDAAYLATDADCTHKATYYKSCTCGEHIAETFEVGDYKHDWAEKRNATSLISEANCHEYACYHKTCALCSTIATSDTDVFYYTLGGYGNHLNVENKDALAATCTTIGYTAGEYCSDCGEWLSGHTAVQATNHVFVLDTENSKDPTCVADGIKVSKCSNPGCDATKTEKGELATGHKVLSLTKIRENAVAGSDCCAYSVVYGGTCSKCTQEVENEPVIEEKHAFYTKVTKEPTCVADGEKSVLCSNVGCKYHDTAKSTLTFEKVPGTGHNWGEPVTAGNLKSYTCGNVGCGEHKDVFEATAGKASLEGISDVESVELSFGENQPAVQLGAGMGELLGTKTNVEISAGNLDEGKKAAAVSTMTPEKQALLGDSEIFEFKISADEGAVTSFGDEVFVTVRIPYTLKANEDAENIAIWYIDDEGEVETMDATYSNGEIVFQTNHFSLYAPAQMTAEEYCEKNGHPAEEQTRVDATCTTDGYVKCLHCDTIVEVLNAIGHDYESSEVTAVSCTENGLTHYACKNCDAAYDQEVYAVGHAYEISEQEEATCVKAGFISYTCSNCQDTYKDKIAQKNHDFSEETVNPTCTKDGYTKKTCSVCGTSSESNYVASEGHKFDGEYFSNPNGHWQKCTVCGENGEAEAHKPNIEEATEEQAVICTVCEFEIAPVKGHEHKYAEEVTEPSCTEEGYTTYTCTCGNTYKDNYVAAKGHTFVYDNINSVFCQKCSAEAGKVAVTFVYYLDGENASRENIQAYENAPFSLYKEKGSAYAKTLDVKYDLTKVEFEGREVTEDKVIEAEDIYCFYFVHTHDYKAVVSDPNCTKGGYTTYTCACGDTYTADEVAALGHSYGEYHTDREGHYQVCNVCGDRTEREMHTRDYDVATEEHGIKCTVCGFEIEPAKGHEHEYREEMVEPTCTTDGYIKFTCAKCGYTYDDHEHSFAPARGHQYGAWITNADGHYKECAVCGEKANEAAHTPDYTEATFEHGITCSVCGYVIENAKICEHDFNYATFFQSGSVADCTICGAGVEYVQVMHLAAYINDNVIWEQSGSGYDAADSEVKAGIRLPKGMPLSVFIDYMNVDELVAFYKAASYKNVSLAKITINEKEVTSDAKVEDMCKIAFYFTGTLDCEHDWKEERHEASCTEGASYKEYCTKCNKVYSETRSSEGLGHEYVLNDDQTECVCSRCGDKVQPITVTLTFLFRSGDSADQVPYVDYMNRSTENIAIRTAPVTFQRFWRELRLREENVSRFSDGKRMYEQNDFMDLIYSYNEGAENLQNGDTFTIYYEMDVEWAAWDEDIRMILEQYVVATCSHVYGSEWMSNATGHWQVCVRCAEIGNYAEHFFVETETVPADCTNGQHSIKVCACGARKDEIVSEPLGHDYQSGYDDNRHFTYCTRCGNQPYGARHTFAICLDPEDEAHQGQYGCAECGMYYENDCVDVNLTVVVVDYYTSIDDPLALLNDYVDEMVSTKEPISAFIKGYVLYAVENRLGVPFFSKGYTLSLRCNGREIPADSCFASNGEYVATLTFPENQCAHAAFVKDIAEGRITSIEYEHEGDKHWMKCPYCNLGIQESMEDHIDPSPVSEEDTICTVCGGIICRHHFELAEYGRAYRCTKCNKDSEPLYDIYVDVMIIGGEEMGGKEPGGDRQMYFADMTILDLKNMYTTGTYNGYMIEEFQSDNGPIEDKDMSLKLGTYKYYRIILRQR